MWKWMMIRVKTSLLHFLSFLLLIFLIIALQQSIFFLYIVMWMQNLNNWATQRLIILVVLLSDSGSGFIHNICRLKICIFVHLSWVVELDTSRRRTLEIVGMALQATKQWHCQCHTKCSRYTSLCYSMLCGLHMQHCSCRSWRWYLQDMIVKSQFFSTASESTRNQVQKYIRSDSVW